LHFGLFLILTYWSFTPIVLLRPGEPPTANPFHGLAYLMWVRPGDSAKLHALVFGVWYPLVWADGAKVFSDHAQYGFPEIGPPLIFGMFDNLGLIQVTRWVWIASGVLGALIAAWKLASAAWRRWGRRTPGVCEKCGYNLTGNVSGVCPECGQLAAAYHEAT